MAGGLRIALGANQKHTYVTFLKDLAEICVSLRYVDIVPRRQLHAMAPYLPYVGKVEVGGYLICICHHSHHKTYLKSVISIGHCR